MRDWEKVGITRSLAELVAKHRGNNLHLFEGGLEESVESVESEESVESVESVERESKKDLKQKR